MKSYRHFSFFRVTVHLKYQIGPDKTLDDISTSEFACAFSLRQLRACCTVNEYFPGRYVKCELEFECLGDCPEDYDTSALNRRCLHNYDQVRKMIIRNSLFVLTCNYLSLYYTLI